MESVAPGNNVPMQIRRSVAAEVSTCNHVASSEKEKRIVPFGADVGQSDEEHKVDHVVNIRSWQKEVDEDMMR